MKIMQYGYRHTAKEMGCPEDAHPTNKIQSNFDKRDNDKREECKRDVPNLSARAENSADYAWFIGGLKPLVSCIQLRMIIKIHLGHRLSTNRLRTHGVWSRQTKGSNEKYIPKYK
jgi:hypothetical protein